jgi:hypothetical protein
MVALFATSHLPLAVAQAMQYDEDTQFTDKNVTQYLAELEEYISVLITHLAYKQEQPNAAISAIPLEKLTMKDFEKGKIKVNTADDTKFSRDEPDMEDEREDLAYTGKELFKKFQEKRSRMGYSSMFDQSAV